METITSDQAIQVALQHQMAGRLQEAEAIYRQILQQQPNNPNALHLLGTIAAQAGQAAAGVGLIDQAIALNPNHPDYHNNKGLILAAMGSLDAAIAAHAQAVALKPDFAEAHNNLGNALLKRGRLPEAVAAYRKTLSLRPEFANAYVNLGVALHAQGQYDQAVAAYQDALKYQPNHPEALSNMGVVLRDQGRPEDAIASYRSAIALRPDYADAYANLAVALEDTMSMDEAMEALNHALTLNPDHAIAHCHKAMTLLRQGDYKQGWQEYEWRAGSRVPRYPFAQPKWDGQDPTGKTILVFADQGYADILQFARYIPLLADRGAEVLLLCGNEFQRLLQGMAGVKQVCSNVQSLPNFDLHCPLSSLPLIFDTQLDTIPANVPYITADPALVEQWRPEIQGDDDRLRVGLIWDNLPGRKLPRFASIRIGELASLAPIQGVRYVCMQGPPTEPLPEGMELARLTGQPRDFADAAAVLANLDLLITIDAPLTHLAGAMGKAVWVLLPTVADWRWGQDRADSPWYPSVRLFRQQTRGQWQDVISQVAQALADGGVSIRQPSGIVTP